MNIDTSDSSDEASRPLGGKASKLKIVDAADDERRSSGDEKEKKESSQPSKKTQSPKKKTPTVKRKPNRPSPTSSNGRARTRTSPTGLNGNYWNVVQYDRHNQTTASNRSVRDDDTSSFTSSTNNKKRDASSSSSSSSSSGDVRTLLYANRTFLTCRSPADSFFLCQALQDVYNNTAKLRIRWCSLADENGDETKIDESTHFKFDYEDTIELQTVLTGIPNVIRHPDKTLTLKKQDIFETNRQLQKSINEQSASSEEPMDLTAEDPPKKRAMIESSDDDDDDDDSLAIKSSTPKSNKRKSSGDSSRKQPPKKRVRKTTGEPAAPIRKRRRTKDIAEITDGEEKSVQPKRTPKKADKPVTTPKAQLFKVQSNRLLNENLTITMYRSEPFFEDKLSVPFISSVVQSKLAIRAVLLNNEALLKSLIDDVDRVCSVHVQRSLHNDVSAIHYAVTTDNMTLLKILLEDIKSPKKNRCPFPTVSMATQSTGRAHVNTFGFRTAQIMAARGAKEGNNALNKDTMGEINTHTGDGLIQFALKMNCSRQIYDLLLEAFPNSNHRVYGNIFHILRAGHRSLAASIIGDIKDNIFYGFNNIHHQVLLYDTEDITINRATSAVKKTRDNFHITPIHCAAINPNSKYLKQLLDIMPEYNILDKYERRPIHFAAACEGPSPLEYLLSRHVDFNDVDRGGDSPLHIAVKNGRAINAEILLRTAKEKAESNEANDQIVHQKFGLASINRMNKSRFYPLHLAVLNNHLECVKVLLEFGAVVDVTTSASSGKMTPLMLACQKGHYKIVVHLIESGAKVEARDRFKRTPLIHACMCGNAHVVSHLLRMGASGKVFDSSLNTALHYAIAYGWYFCVRLLIESGANLNCVNAWQTTCLAAGFLKGHYGLCDYLLTEHKVDINFQTDDGLTLVMLTMDLQVSPSVIQQLEYIVTKHRANCTSVDSNGRNAFHYLAANTSQQDSAYLSEVDRAALEKNYFRLAQTLLDNRCNPNQMDSKAQSALMVALQAGNFILVNYLINQAKIEINSDTSQDRKTLLHYFAMKCDRHDLVETLMKIPVDDEMKKMGQIVDDSGRTPLHECVAKFDQFCQANESATSTDLLKKQYQSIVRMIQYCLETIECDPDLEIVSTSNSSPPAADGESDEETDTMKTTQDVVSDVKTKQTSIFFLLRTVPFADQTSPHPLAMFLQKTKNINVFHHENHRTPLLQAVSLQQYPTSHMLIQQDSCDVNLSSSNIVSEGQQTPLIVACKLQCLNIVRDLLNHSKCDVLACDYQNNQAIHYYLSTSQRSNEYVEIFRSFIEKVKALASNGLNVRGKHDRTPLHIAVYHNLGTIDATIDIEQILIDRGCDLLARDTLGNLPMHNVFCNRLVGSDPVELCVLLLKAVDKKSIDTKNYQGNTPLHLAVGKCSTVCVMLLQEHHASLISENNLSNSIIGTCIASGHLNLFVTFLHQTVDIDLGKTYCTPVSESENPAANGDESEAASFVFGGKTPKRQRHKSKAKSNGIGHRLAIKDDKNSWRWKYLDFGQSKQQECHSLNYLIIKHDWQGALSLIVSDFRRFQLTYVQIVEAAILNQKLNLVLRLLSRLQDKHKLQEKTSQERNLFHLMAGISNYDQDLFQQTLLVLHEHGVPWNLPDVHGSYPIHYACVRRNYAFVRFLTDKYQIEFSSHQVDASGNTAVGLLFWSLTSATTFDADELRPWIKSPTQLDCLCNYDNEIAMNPFSFGYLASSMPTVVYPPTKADGGSTNIRSSPLINAIVHNNFALVKVLLELGADVNFPDEAKGTPLMHAVRQNNLDIVKVLLNKTYTPKTVDQSLGHRNVHKKTRFLRSGKLPRFFLGATAASMADALDKPDDDEDEKFSVTSSIDLDISDALGRTCIHHLVQPFPDGSYTGNIDLLRLLHEAGASLTKHDVAGLTPLQYGAINGSQHLCDELISLMREKTPSLEAIIERFDINDPNKKLLDQPDFYADAQQYIDKYLSTHPSRTVNPAYQVDRSSGMSSTGAVVIDLEKNEPYDVSLTKTDVSYGTHGLYNFYRMQIIKHKSKTNLYFLFTRWGRIGVDEGQHQLTPFASLDECRKEFFKVFREKTANAWKDTDHFESKPRKYTLIPLVDRDIRMHASVPIDFESLQSNGQHPPSKLQSPIYEEFLQTLISQQAIRKNVDRTRLDVDWMPVSQLKRERLQKARDILIQIKKDLDKQQQLTLTRSRAKTPGQQAELQAILESIYKHSNEYYSIVPLRGYLDAKLSVINNENELKNQEKILDDLSELELSYKILLGAQAHRQRIAPVDYLYRSINCQFEAMNKDDIDSQLILRYIWTSSPQIQVEQIFKVARPKEDDRLFQWQVDNHYLLWHGTGICNLISILSRGLLVGPLAATANGALFGKGIYTADTFAKSLGYCSGVKQDDGERCFMLLCEVALGKMKEIGSPDDDDDDTTKALNLEKFQSRKGVGRSIPDPRHTITRNYGVRMPLGNIIDNTEVKPGYYGLPYNEYIVYDESQVALRYLVQFRR